MKLRFYIDVRSEGYRGTDIIQYLHASTSPNSIIPNGFTRIAFDVEMPPSLFKPPHDILLDAVESVIVVEPE